MYDVEAVLGHYITTALWASLDDDGTALDESYGPEDLHPDTIVAMRADVVDFLDVIDQEGLTEAMEASRTWADPAQVGHDFWLTRNHHGAGFWDRGEGDLGTALTKWAQVPGSADLYVGDDGKIHQM